SATSPTTSTPGVATAAGAARVMGANRVGASAERAMPAPTVLTNPLRVSRCPRVPVVATLAPPFADAAAIRSPSDYATLETARTRCQAKAGRTWPPLQPIYGLVTGAGAPKR